MQVTYEFQYDINLVFKTLTDSEFLKQRALALGSLDAMCESRGVTPDCHVKLVRERQIKVPAVLSAFLKKIQTATTNEQWAQQERQFSCENSTAIEGAPLSIKGNVSLVPSELGCTFIANFETKAKIMFGKKNLQQYAARTIARELQLECEYTARYFDSL